MALSELTRRAMRTSYGSGRYTNFGVNENDYLCYNTRKQNNKPGVIIAHPRGSSASGMFADPYWTRLYADLCEEYVVCISDMGGQLQWGNMGTRNSAAAQVNWLWANGADPNLGIGLVGMSMGGLAAFNIAKYNPALIKFVANLVPATSIQDLMVVSGGVYANEISTAYGGYTEAMYGADWDPYYYRANYPNVKTAIWSSPVDSICRPFTHYAMRDAKPSHIEVFDVYSSAGIAPSHELSIPYCIEGNANPNFPAPKVADWCNARRYDSF